MLTHPCHPNKSYRYIHYSRDEGAASPHPDPKPKGWNDHAIDVHVVEQAEKVDGSVLKEAAFGPNILLGGNSEEACIRNNPTAAF